MNLLKLSRTQELVMKRLGEFKFLTLSQMLKLEVNTQQYKNLWKQVINLLRRRRAFISCIKFNTIDRVGRVEDIYYLTKQGVKYLTELEIPIENILIPKGKVISAKDYYHRKITIDFQISIWQWVKASGFTIPLYYRYFDKVGENRIKKNMRSKSRIQLDSNRFVIPDSLFRLQRDTYDRIFLFELHNGKDSKRILDQIHNHARLLTRRKLHQQYDYPQNKSYTILILFNEESTLKALIKRVKAEKEVFENIHQFFLCSAISDFHEADWTKNWISILGDKEVVFPIKRKS